MSPPFTFTSECPSCAAERLLAGYPPEELEEMLRTGADIEAYCGSCDERWPISTEERADLARTLDRRR